MKFIDKLKKDKKFRYQIVSIVILAILIFNSGAPDKKEVQSQEVCNQYNTLGFIVTTGQFNNCEASGCNVQYNLNVANWPLVGTIIDINQWVQSWLGYNTEFSTCVPEVATGKYVMANSKSAAAKQCVSQSASDAVKTNFWGDDVYLCITGDPAQQCNSAERPIADIIQGMGLDVSCKTAYYIALFGGGMIALMMLGMFL